MDLVTNKILIKFKIYIRNKKLKKCLKYILAESKYESMHVDRQIPASGNATTNQNST